MHAGILGVGSANKIWGTSSSDLYFVGNDNSSGFIAHYDGNMWVKSKITWPVQDIYGSVNKITGQTEILAVASTVFNVPSGKNVIKIEGNKATIVADDGLPVSLKSIWFCSNKAYYIVGDGLYKCKNIGDTWQNIPYTPTKYTEAIRGQGLNDIVIAGDYRIIFHFNGLTWQNYTMQVPLSNGSFNAVAIKNNLIIAVGDNGGSQGVITMGRR